MVITRKLRSLKLNSPLVIYLVAGVSSVALAVVVVLLSTRTVQADVRLIRQAIAPAVSPIVASAAPAAPSTQPIASDAKALSWKKGLHGIASWYGGIFNGRKTASGERFDMYAMTACHPSLPFGSIVRVVNRSNKRSVVVKITDRGDLVNQGRVIDLSYAAAEKLAITKAGLAKVDLEVLSLGTPQRSQ
jgi:rare lipoprotein A